MSKLIKKYADIHTNGQLVPKETDNYRYLMNNSSIFDIGNGYPDFAGDDVDFVDEQKQSDIANSIPEVNNYTWADKLYDASAADNTWDAMYAIIFNSNVVIESVLNSTNGTGSARNQIYGEALMHRADAYLTLVRAYSKAYDAGTAPTDLGVPMLLSPSVDADLSRVSLQQVYAQIITDLKKAAPLMAATSYYNILASRSAAFALLVRAYLDTSDYANAEAYTDSMLTLNNHILDYNTLSGTLLRNLNNPELLSSKRLMCSRVILPSCSG